MEDKLNELTCVQLRQVRDAAQEVAEIMAIPEVNEDEPLTLAGKLRKVPESFERYVSTTTRQYVGVGGRFQ